MSPEIKRRGLMLVLSSPSGAGKTTLSRLLLESDPAITLSVSATTRPKRATEVEGRDYHFISREEFDRLLTTRGFEILKRGGVSALSLLLSLLSKLDRLGPRSEAHLPAVHRLLNDLSRSGHCNRCHVAVAAKPAPSV